jgi:spore coat polysaccharide biosynthesis protein SpsF (cytidylyltransferase family)
MKTGILFIVRLGSTRLSQKHLIFSKNKTFLEWLVLRFSNAFEEEINTDKVKLIIATSDLPENKKLEEVFKNNKAEVFYGSNDNIPLRQLECAKTFDLDNLIIVDGDDILCSVEASKIVYQNLIDGNVKAIKSEGLPLGLNVIGYKTEYLQMCLNNTINQKVIETGWGRIFDENLQSIKLGEFSLQNELRFTLDYQDDADFFDFIIDDFGNQIVGLSDCELINYVLENKVFEINSGVNEIYWDNFNKSKLNEL